MNPVIAVLLAAGIFNAQVRDRPEDPVAVARRFMPPRSELATLYTFDDKTQQFGPDTPAALNCHVLGSDSEDIVFAYYSPQSHVLEKSLFVDLLHSSGEGYEKVFELSYRAQVLFVPEAIRLLRLPGMQTDAVAVMAAEGAALGGHLDMFVWRDPWGWQNVFPPNGAVEYFYFRPAPDGMLVALSSAHHPGRDNMPPPQPPPTWFRWNGKEFAKAQPP